MGRIDLTAVTLPESVLLTLSGVGCGTQGIIHAGIRQRIGRWPANKRIQDKPTSNRYARGGRKSVCVMLGRRSSAILSHLSKLTPGTAHKRTTQQEERTKTPDKNKPKNYKKAMQNRHSVAVYFHFSNNISGPEGAGDAVEDFLSDEERDTRMLRPMRKLRRKSLNLLKARSLEPPTS